MFEDGDHLVGHAFGIALRRALPGQLLERLLRREAGDRSLLGILIGEFVEREAAALGDPQGSRQRFGITAKQPRHFLRSLEIAVGMTLPTEAGVVDRAIVPDAGHDVLQDAAGGFVKQHVIGNDGRHPCLRRQVRQLVEAKLVVGAPAQCQRHVGAVSEDLAQASQMQSTGLIRLIGDQDRDQSFAICNEIAPLQPAVRLAAALLAERQQPAEPCIGRPVGGIDQHRHAVVEIEPAADDQAHAGRLGGLVGADDAGERIAVDDRQRLDAEERGLLEQVLAGAGPAQEREMRGDLQFDVAPGVHPKIPCRNQRCEPVASCSPSPAR